jgi:hypothetical protein
MTRLITAFLLGAIMGAMLGIVRERTTTSVEVHALRTDLDLCRIDYFHVRDELDWERAHPMLIFPKKIVW